MELDNSPHVNNLEHPELVRPPLLFTGYDRPPSGSHTIAQVHLANALDLACTATAPKICAPVRQYELETKQTSELAQPSPDIQEVEAIPVNHAIALTGLTRTCPNLCEKTRRPIEERIHDAASAALMSLRPRRQPISDLAEQTATLALTFLETQLPATPPAEIDTTTSALIAGFGAIAEAATYNEQFALTGFAADRIVFLTSNLPALRPNMLPEQHYAEAMATLHSALAMRAYGLLRAYGELTATSDGRDAHELLMQARSDEARVRQYVQDRIERSMRPEIRSSYIGRDIRTMRYLMGYHHMTGTVERASKQAGISEFLNAICSDAVINTSPPTIIVPLLEYTLGAHAQVICNRLLRERPLTTQDALEYEAKQEAEAQKALATRSL